MLIYLFYMKLFYFYLFSIIFANKNIMFEILIQISYDE